MNRTMNSTPEKILPFVGRSIHRAAWGRPAQVVRLHPPVPRRGSWFVAGFSIFAASGGFLIAIVAMVFALRSLREVAGDMVLWWPSW
jgi:hypothetical protein